MTTYSRFIPALLIAVLAGACSTVHGQVVDSASVRAHVSFLAGESLHGRGSATADEALAAAYVTAQFQSYGLKPAPTLDGYMQTAPVPPEVAKAANLPAGAVTTSAIGYLPGSDPQAGVLLISAHLDHVGVRKGVIFPGANDDASGTTAVLELARALAARGPHRRGILFVCYGGEELGGVGSRYFASHPPIPLADIVANLGFEMIGAADPSLSGGAMMMTGFERSTLGTALAAHGALVTADPYVEQRFFERSDNYQLALAGVVAHTIGGWAMTPTYHQPSDTIANLDIAFMTRAIQSLIGPVRWLANSDFRPQWTGEGQPKP